MDEKNETQWDANLNDWIRAIVDNELDEATREHRSATAHCPPQGPIHLRAEKGFDPEWHPPLHPSDCRYCRRAARVAFRNADPGPGKWLLGDRTDESRPRWWKGAIEDYLQTAPIWVRFWAQAASAANAIQDWQAAPMTAQQLAASPIARMIPSAVKRNRVGSAMAGDTLVARLYTVESKVMTSSERPEGNYVLQVLDLKQGEPRSVKTGLIAQRSMYVTVPLTKQEHEQLKGEVVITYAQAKELLGSDEKTLYVVPPMELGHENDTEDDHREDSA